MAEPTEKSIREQERRIGLKASRKVEAYLRTVIDQKLKRGKTTEEKSLHDTAKVKHKMGEYRLLGLNLSSPVHGYIQNYGFVGVREATSVYYKASRYNISRSQRKAHPFNLPERKIFEEIYDKSGVIPFLVEQLANTRTQAVEIVINDMILQFNREQNGK
ncbi:hypothetical protein [Aequorivita echinoideorum]|uniref:Phage protein, HK97 gp10 family n=1 Tax=Aequorivita echinoideorum TaxID=1549647 RepID=A0ABS5S728_9FLAO|nr:hypothetical protein [Aequorivita echinoideorum]MBT0607660.1 hypothetical protein [Aequorivita echinoideorum]